MQFYDFIVSRDVREHLKNIGYQFTSLEAAWLIYQCKRLTMQERHQAWQELMETMPDYQNKEIFGDYTHLFSYLRWFIRYEKQLMEQFFTPEQGCIYGCWVGDWCLYPYSDFEACFERTKNIAHAADAPLRFSKRRIDCDTYISLTMLSNRDILEVSDSDGGLEADAHCCNAFVWLMARFPSPFQKGDILCRIYEDANFRDKYLVLTEENFFTRGEPLDGCIYSVYDVECDVSGYQQPQKGKLVCGKSVIHYDPIFYHETCLDYEYCRENLLGKRRVLVEISHYLKGLIPLADLLNAYHTILLEESLADMKKN